MHEHELFILEHLRLTQAGKLYLWKKSDAMISACKDLTTKSFGSSTSEFIAQLEALSITSASLDGFRLWFAIESYFVNAKTPEDKSAKMNVIVKQLTDIHQQAFKEDGTGLLRQYIAKGKLIRNVYLTEDKNLIQLFQQYLPIPRSTLFAGYNLPSVIAKRELEQQQCIAAFLKRNTHCLGRLEHIVLQLQRTFRAKRHKQEEEKRVISHFNYNPLTVTAKLHAANRPYIPQACNRELAQRIYLAAARVKLFGQVRHLTTSQHLRSILDDGLFGRRTLLAHYMPFSRAALKIDDIANGDGNAIYLAPNEVDTEHMPNQNFLICFNLQKLMSGRLNPCIFYKQRDLCFTLNRLRKISLGNSELCFSHTNQLIRPQPGSSNLQFFDSNNKVIAYALLPNYQLIAYNITRLHQILSLNFFRFVDQLKPTSTGNPNLQKTIYLELGKLDDNKLEAWLQTLGKHMTDTAEFNFYGAYLIDFDAVISFTNTDDDYCLHLANFINALKSDNQVKLSEAMQKLPSLFESQRFKDYLLANNLSPAITEKLLPSRPAMQQGFVANY